MDSYIRKADAEPYLTRYIPGVEAVERSKIDKIIEDIHNESYSESVYGEFYKDTNKIISVKDVLEILKRNIGD